MTQEELLYIKTGRNIQGSEESRMFGKPCFKIKGKAFVCFFQNEMVFKLSGISHQEAISLKGSRLFDPSGKNRPMKEWVQVPFVHSDNWTKYAQDAFDYVSGTNGQSSK